MLYVPETLELVIELSVRNRPFAREEIYRRHVTSATATSCCYQLGICLRQPLEQLATPSLRSL